MNKDKICFKKIGCFRIRSINFIFWILFLALLVVNVFILATNVSFAQGRNLSEEENNIQLFKDNQKSVVYVALNVVYKDLLTAETVEQPAGTGTGFVWSDDGLIVTNFHVVGSENSLIKIRLFDLSVYDAKIVGLAPSKDLALLKIDAPKEKLRPVRLGDSKDLQVGNKVLAIGNPYGFDHTLTVGVISALGREIVSPNNRKITGVLQTDAAINPGNSGGPLLNSNGELVGIATAIFSSSGSSAGIGFAIPVNIAKKIIPKLQKYGKINRPIIGLGIVDDSVALRFGIEGVIIRNAIENYDAYKKGVRGLSLKKDGSVALGDVIVGIDDMPIRNSDDLFAILEEKKAGDVIVLKTMKQNKKKSYRVQLYESR